MPNQPDLPVVELSLTQAQAQRLTWAAFIFGALAIVANGFTAMGFFPVWALQLCGGLAMIFTGLSIYCAKMAPSAQRTAAPTPKEASNDDDQGSD